ncbi:hypothetical protein GGI05_005367, partial [Coemansia sp. RSA 2603]
MNELSDIPVADYSFGNGWVPGSGRRVSVGQSDHTWNITRIDHSDSFASALKVITIIT